MRGPVALEVGPRVCYSTKGSKNHVGYTGHRQSTRMSFLRPLNSDQNEALRPRSLCASAEAVESPVRSPDKDLSSSFSLDNVRSSLIRQEDTIIFFLIERSQFARNAAVYEADAVPVPGFSKSGARWSLLEYLLREQEQLHGKIRRFTSPDEHAFFPDDLPPLVIPPLEYPKVLPPSVQHININNKILEMYKSAILPGITREGDDKNYGSSAMHDVFCLQALSKRIHFGKFVAEAKFRAEPEKYTELIRNKDADGIMETLTNEEVEKRVVERVRLKAATFGQDVGAESNGNKAYKVHPDVVADLYTHLVVPLTKEVQVQCLLRRFDEA